LAVGLARHQYFDDRVFSWWRSNRNTDHA
jgi:hypothetical protein